MNAIEKLIQRHLSTPWRGSDKIAQGLRIALESLDKIMQMNKAEEMRILSAKTTNQIRELVKEK